MGLDGFKVVSSFDVEKLQCTDLSNEIYQLAVLLYPPEYMNEKFMIKLRDCVFKLSESHPVKKWMKWVAESNPLGKKDQEKKAFLLEVIRSQFNLITDLTVKNKIISLLHEVPETTLPEVLLKSYLYLLIGNITRSDNYLRELINTPPRVNWEKTGLSPGLYHRIAKDEIKQIFQKLANHPADRRSFELFVLYAKNYYNDETFLAQLQDFDAKNVEGNLWLKYIEGIAPSILKFLRVQQMGDERKFIALRETNKYPLEVQAYWIWPFMDVDPLVSPVMVEEVARIEKVDQLWFIYLLENEKIGDLYGNKFGKSFLPARRPFLKEGLSNPSTFMMSLYKLIELGDISSDLVLKTSEQITQ